MKGTARFDEDRCKGCRLCVSVCPRKIVVMKTDRLNAKGFHPAGLSEAEENIGKCTGCAFCAIICPDCVIRVERERAEEVKGGL